MRYALALALLLATPATAAASGGGLGPVFGGAGATAPGHAFTYIAIPAGRQSVIQVVRRDGGAIDRWRTLPGVYGIPSVAYDGSTTGLSADGTTLVLSEAMSRYPPRRTRLQVLDTFRLKVRQRLSLPGYASVDAVSPDGRLIYVVRYTAPMRDITRYEVLVYDREHPGAPERVVDPEEPEEQMGGVPWSRATDAAGRWVYTLYGAEEPFIHALDTVGRTAKCIDLPQLAGKDLSPAKLAVHGARLEIGAFATVDTRTFAVSDPPLVAWRMFPLVDAGTFATVTA